MREKEIGVECGVIEWVQCNTLRWFGYMEKNLNGEFIKKVYGSEVEGPNLRQTIF